MLRLGVLVSGGGTNLQAIIDNISSGYIPDCEVVTVVSNNSKASALSRAEAHKIPHSHISKKQFETLAEFDDALLKHFQSYNVNLVVLAGYMSMVGEVVVNYYKNRIINIHPSLIPSFCGKGVYGIIPHQKAIEYGVKVTGATVQFIDYDYDTGPIIMQKAVEVIQGDTPEALQLRVMKQAEWIILPEAIKKISEDKLKINGRSVTILD